MAQHLSGEGGAYTSKRMPVVLVFAQEFDRIDDAYFMEKCVQGRSRAKREALIQGRFNDLPRLSKKNFERRWDEYGLVNPPVSIRPRAAYSTSGLTRTAANR